MKRWLSLLLCLLVVLPLSAADAGKDPKTVLLAFYRLAMQDFKPAEACEKPVNPRSMFWAQVHAALALSRTQFNAAACTPSPRTRPGHRPLTRLNRRRKAASLL